MTEVVTVAETLTVTVNDGPAEVVTVAVGALSHSDALHLDAANHPLLDQANEYTGSPQTITLNDDDLGAEEYGLIINREKPTRLSPDPTGNLLDLRFETWQPGGKIPYVKTSNTLLYASPEDGVVINSGGGTSDFALTVVGNLNLVGGMYGDTNANDTAYFPGDLDNGTIARGTHTHGYSPHFLGLGELVDFASYNLENNCLFDDIGAPPSQEMFGNFLVTSGYSFSGTPLTYGKLTFYSGDTAMAGCNHIWAALYSYQSGMTKVLLGQSADEPGATWAANSPRDFTFTSPITPPGEVEGASEFIFFVALYIDAATPPSLRGLTAPGPAQGFPDNNWCLHADIGATATAPPGFHEYLTPTPPNIAMGRDFYLKPFFRLRG